MVKGNFKAGPFTLTYIDCGGLGPVGLVIGSALFYSRTFPAQLNQAFRMIYLDHRGFAVPSGEVEPSDYTMDKILEDIESFRRERNLGSVTVFGHSAHGYMALEYAKKYPDSVSQVCVVATGPSHGSHMLAAEQNWETCCSPERKRQYQMDLQKMELAIQQDPQSRFIQFCLAMRAKGFYDWQFDASDLWAGVQTFLPAMDYLFGIVFRDIKVENDLKELKKPVLMILGRCDYQVAPFWTWEPYYSQFWKLKVRIFERSAHNPQIEESILFYREVLQWDAENKEKSQ